MVFSSEMHAQAMAREAHDARVLAACSLVVTCLAIFAGALFATEATDLEARNHYLERRVATLEDLLDVEAEVCELTETDAGQYCWRFHGGYVHIRETD